MYTGKLFLFKLYDEFRVWTEFVLLSKHKSVDISCHNWNSAFHWALSGLDLLHCWGKLHLLFSKLFSFALESLKIIFCIIQTLPYHHSPQSSWVQIIEVWLYNLMTITKYNMTWQVHCIEKKMKEFKAKIRYKAFEWSIKESRTTSRNGSPKYQKNKIKGY